MNRQNNIKDKKTSLKNSILEKTGERLDKVPKNKFHFELDNKTKTDNYSNYFETGFFGFLLGVIGVETDVFEKHWTVIPNVNFETGEIFDKPGVFLDFSKPESLDDQLAEIYGLTDEERHLMTKDLKPWKDKVDVNADR